ncbi:MAG: VWA domain-containing protein [Acidobacteria bacterium]|nr:VWA domain-containing protein [Acidobacteriota bacterium]
MNLSLQTRAFHILRPAICLWLIFFAVNVVAQEKKKEQPPPDLRIETIEARLPLRAWDTKGNRLTNLTTKDVVVIENREGRQVTSLKFEPANILLVLDQSVEFGTIKNGRPKLQRESSGSNRLLTAPAAVDFAETLISLLGEADHLAIIQYSDQVELIQNWTADRQEARQALRTKFRQGDKTRFYDALQLAADTLSKSPEGRRVMVLLTDGVDTVSQTQKQAALASLTQTGVTLFIVSWAEFIKKPVEDTKPKILSGSGGTPRDSARAGVSINVSPWVFKRNKELKNYIKKAEASAKEFTQVAENSGGELYLPKDFDELLAKPIEIMREVGAQYTLTYLTEKTANEVALRDVEVLGARSITIRARKKFYIGENQAKEETKK